VKNRVHNLIDSGVLSQFLIAYAPSTIGADSYQAVVLTNGTEDTLVELVQLQLVYATIVSILLDYNKSSGIWCECGAILSP